MPRNNQLSLTAPRSPAVPNNMTGFNAYTGLETGNSQWNDGTCPKNTLFNIKQTPHVQLITHTCFTFRNTILKIPSCANEVSRKSGLLKKPKINPIKFFFGRQSFAILSYPTKLSP